MLNVTLVRGCSYHAHDLSAGSGVCALATKRAIQVIRSVPQLRRELCRFWGLCPSYEKELCRFLGLCPSYEESYIYSGSWVCALASKRAIRLLGLCPSYEESYAGSWVCAHSYEESYERANDDNTYDVHSLVCYGITSLVSYVNRSSSQRDRSQRNSSQSDSIQLQMVPRYIRLRNSSQRYSYNAQ